VSRPVAPHPHQPRPVADYPDAGGDTIVLHVPDTDDTRPRILDAAGRAWRRQIGFRPAGEEPR
jgi:hypothetical protein